MGIWSANIIFLHRFRWWLVAGAYCMAVPSYYLKQSWFIVDWNLGIQRSENLSEIEVSLSIMHCKYVRIIRFNALKISTVECRYNMVQYCKISHKWLQELRQNINQKPWRASYGMSFVNNFDKIDRAITALHCTLLIDNQGHTGCFNSSARKKNIHAHTHTYAQVNIKQARQDKHIFFLYSWWLSHNDRVHYSEILIYDNC